MFFKDVHEEQLQILESWAKEILSKREFQYVQCSVKSVDTSDWNIDSILNQIDFK